MLKCLEISNKNPDLQFLCKASTCNAGDLGSIPVSERSPGEGNGNPLQDSCLENPMDGGTWLGYSPWGCRVRHGWATSLTHCESEVKVLVTQSCSTLCNCRAPPSMRFSRQEYWSGLPFPSPGDLPNPGIKSRSPVSQTDSLPFWAKVCRFTFLKFSFQKALLH